MKKERRDKIITGLQGTDAALAMIDYLQEKIEQLNSVDEIETIEDVKGRQQAIRHFKSVIGLLEKKEQKENKYEDYS